MRHVGEMMQAKVEGARSVTCAVIHQFMQFLADYKSILECINGVVRANALTRSIVNLIRFFPRLLSYLLRCFRGRNITAEDEESYKQCLNPSCAGIHILTSDHQSTLRLLKTFQSHPY